VSSLVGFETNIAAVGIGCAIGASEIISRYRDLPWGALSSLPAAGYVALNGAASALALAVISTFGWKFGASPHSVEFVRVAVAGFGAMAVLRSSLLTVHAGGQDVTIGPNSLLMVLLSACDRGIDRQRAADRADEVKRIMEGVSFVKARDSLPAVALALMQNLGPPDQAALGFEVEKLSNAAEITDDAKSLLLGLAIATTVGPHVLESAKEALGSEILSSPQS
jgi:hypothetical protein